MGESSNINVEEFSSRKLWEMVSEDDSAAPENLQAAIDELARRRHYLAELERIGKLTPKG